MARKKIVFVIVEGISEQDALGAILSNIYDKDTVWVQVLRKDITSEYGVSPSNILSKLGDEVRGYANSNSFKKSDFKEIIHIVDMDGAYIPNENVIEDHNASNPVYSLTEIRTADKPGIEVRNQNKRANINKICSCKEMWSVPYSAYYMSCNLDHVLYNKLNSTDEEKERDSFQFAKRYKEKTKEFLSFICESDFSVTGDLKASWDFIKLDLHSLERYTNFGICFKEIDE